MVDSGLVESGEYGNSADCSWSMTCSNSTFVPTLTFTAFSTEANFDYVYFYDVKSIRFR